jgi:cytochrome c556
VTNTEESESDEQRDSKFQRSFNIFSEEFVMTKIIKGQEIYDMKRVKEEFDKTVACVENLNEN